MWWSQKRIASFSSLLDNTPWLGDVAVRNSQSGSGEHDEYPEFLLLPGNTGEPACKTYRAVFKEGVDRDKEECIGYLVERKCYQQALDNNECKTDLCKIALESGIKNINDQMKPKFNCSGPGW